MCNWNKCESLLMPCSLLTGTFSLFQEFLLDPSKKTKRCWSPNVKIWAPLSWLVFSPITSAVPFCVVDFIQVLTHLCTFTDVYHPKAVMQGKAKELGQNAACELNRVTWGQVTQNLPLSLSHAYFLL